MSLEKTARANQCIGMQWPILLTVVMNTGQCIQITEPARFQCLTSFGKCGSPIEMDVANVVIVSFSRV
jgi:hypothetical protein